MDVSPPAGMAMETEWFVDVHKKQVPQRHDRAPPFLGLTFSLDNSIIFSNSYRKIMTTGCYHHHAHINCFKTWQLGCCNKLANYGKCRSFFLKEVGSPLGSDAHNHKSMSVDDRCHIGQPRSTTEG